MDSATAVQNVLAHHGVKGMHWGSRKGSSGGSHGEQSSSGSKEVSVKTGSLNGKATIKTKGGQGHPAHPDAVAARVVQQKLRKSGSHSLSNAEIRQVIERTNLESQLSKAAPKHPLVRGAKVVGDFLQSPQGKQTISTLIQAKAQKETG